MGNRIGTALGLLLLLGACDAAPAKVPTRGLHDADGVLGSCEDACGEASLQGNCWCDASCVGEGDCCSDKVEVCGGGGPVEPETPLCVEVDDCPAGLTCDTSACYSACRSGEDCEDACVGICTEPTQQSLPHPSGGSGDAPDDAPADDDADDPEGDDDSLPRCDCPEADLCVPLCPVCPPEVPEEDCQCQVVCVSV